MRFLDFERPSKRDILQNTILAIPLNTRISNMMNISGVNMCGEILTMGNSEYFFPHADVVANPVIGRCLHDPR